MPDAPFTGFWSKLERPFLVLAPMEDVTDTVFRSLLALIAPPQVFFTEFANAARIAAKKTDALDRLRFDPVLHRPLVVQIWGTREEDLRKAIHHIRRMGADGVDLNMGCPQDSVTRKGSGAGHIRNPDHAAALIRGAIEACGEDIGGAPSLPLGVKTRTGWDVHDTEAWLGKVLSCAPAVVTLHARTARQQSEGNADWNQFACLRSQRDSLSPGTFCIGNGDIRTAGETVALCGPCGLDGVMSGRALFEDPLLFGSLSRGIGRMPAPRLPEVDAMLENAQTFASLPVHARARLALLHTRMYRDEWGDRRNFGIMKKYYKVYLRGDPILEDLRNRLNDLWAIDTACRLLEEWTAQG